MLLTLTTTHRPATDLGYLLYKNPPLLVAAVPWGYVLRHYVLPARTTGPIRGAASD